MPGMPLKPGLQGLMIPRGQANALKQPIPFGQDRHPSVSGLLKIHFGLLAALIDFPGLLAALGQVLNVRFQAIAVRRTRGGVGRR